MNQEIRDIVHQSYSVFSKYKAVLPLDVCTQCCMTENQASALVSMAVKQIPVELLYKYNTAAKTELPSIEEFKHFLPRFLELTAELKFAHHSAELVLSRFEYYSKDEWTETEHQLLQNYAKASLNIAFPFIHFPNLKKLIPLSLCFTKPK